MEQFSMAAPLDYFYKWEHETPGNIFFRQPIPGEWRTYSFQEAGNEIRRIASALKALKLSPQSNIAILSKNCAHWIMADLAIWMAGHVSVPLYPTLTAPTIRLILEHSESKAIFLGKLDNFEIQRAGIPDQLHKISFPLYGIREGEDWDHLLLRNEPLKENGTPDGTALATIMYTSGTTGYPKGVMVSFKSISYVLENALRGFMLRNSNERFFSYLPLSHIAERALVEMGALYSGSTISFSESLEKFPVNLMETQPTVFLAVPRIWAKFQEKILEKMPQKKLERILSIPLVNSIFKKTIRRKLGLGKARWILTGAAPISKNLLEWFMKLDVVIHEVYGMTENLAYSHINLHELKFGTVGKAWPGIEVAISDQGEILTKHPGVMMGYYKEPSMTAEVMTQDGFLKTGDKGEVDPEGFLTITGRLKDLFKTDKGKYVAPGPIELKLSENADIEQVCVVGMGIPQPIALIVLSAAGKVKSKGAIIESLSASLALTNQLLEHYERLESAVIMKEDWTIENGMITPTLKIKRNEVEKIHLPNYPRWFREEGVVVWE